MTQSTMFPTKGLFQSLPCPERSTCKRVCCPFSHDPNIKLPPIAHIIAEAPKSILKPSSSGPVASSSRTPAPDGSIPAKRSVSSPLRNHSRNGTSSSDEPPRKLQKVGTLQKPGAIPSAQPAKIVSSVRLLIWIVALIPKVERCSHYSSESSTITCCHLGPSGGCCEIIAYKRRLQYEYCI